MTVLSMEWAMHVDNATKLRDALRYAFEHTACPVAEQLSKTITDALQEIEDAPVGAVLEGEVIGTIPKRSLN